MKKNILIKKILGIFCLSTSFLLYGQQKISLEHAKKIAENITQITYKNLKNTKPKLNLAYISAKNDSGTKKSLSNENEIYYYIFNINENDGFITISGNDIAIPILTYSSQGNFNTENSPPALLWWMEQYKKEIQYAIDQKLKQTPETKNMWLNAEKKIELSSLPSNKTNLNTYVQGTNLVKAKWSQRNPYNNLVDSKLKHIDCQSYATGCTATAMAQVMYYWKHPIKVLDTIPGYITRTLKLDVPSVPKGTPINWENILDTYSNNYNKIQSDAIAQLMFYVGVSVKMNYVCSSSAWPSVDALKNYFGYDSSAKVELRHKNKDIWDSILRSQIDLLQPIIYVGADDEKNAHHSFICDGYKQDQNGILYFHFNWGWNGKSNNYCATNAIIPNKKSTNYSRNKTYERIYINIKPALTCSTPTGLSTSSISTDSAILNWNEINDGQNYTVEYKPSSASNWMIVSTSDTLTSFTLSGLISNTEYLWRVKTNCSTSYNSEYAQSSFTTLDNCFAPSELTTSSISTDSAILNWNEINDGQNYTVEYKPSSASNWMIVSTSDTLTSFTLSGLISNTEYLWRVKTNCSTSYNSEYAQSSFTTLDNCFAPSELTISSISTDSAILNWNEIIRGQNYTVVYKPSSASNWMIASTSDTLTSFTLSGLNPNTEYLWRVKTNCSTSYNSEYAQSSFKTNSTYTNNNYFSIYPNPVKNIIYIKGLNADKESYSLVKIIDRNGQIVKILNIKIENTISIDVSDLSPNIYYLTISGNSYKFIKN